MQGVDVENFALRVNRMAISAAFETKLDSQSASQNPKPKRSLLKKKKQLHLPATSG